MRLYFRAILFLVQLCTLREVSCEENREAALAKIVAEYDTIVIGKFTSLSIRHTEVRTPLRWAVVVAVDEVLKGNDKTKTLRLYFHSPTHEFGTMQNEDLAGKPCVWALRKKGDDVVAFAAPFFQQHFTDADLALLRELVKKSK